MDKQKIRGYCIVSAFTVVLYLALSNMDRLTGALRVAGGLLAPFFVGVAIAFILNNVMVLFEKKVFYRLAEGRNPRSARMVRPLSLVSTYLVTFAAFGVLLWVVVPQLAASVVTLGNNIPAYLESLRVLGNRLQGELTLPAEALEQIAAWFSQAADVLLNFLVDFVPRMLGYVVSFGGGIVTFVIGIIVSIHLLMSKEKLLSQVGRLGRAFLPERAAGWLGGAARVSVETFGNYVSGQLLDAMIVGIVSVIGLSIFRFPYAMLIGVLSAIFCSLFLGVEYGDGTMRNKIIAGHKRTDIYLSNLITNLSASLLMCLSYILSNVVLGIPLLGFQKASLSDTAIDIGKLRHGGCALLGLHYDQPSDSEQGSGAYRLHCRNVSDAGRRIRD